MKKADTYTPMKQKAITVKQNELVNIHRRDSSLKKDEKKEIMDSKQEKIFNKKHSKDSPESNSHSKLTEAIKLDEENSKNMNLQNTKISKNIINKNNEEKNFKIINLKQKLQDHILFANDRKNPNKMANLAKPKSKPRNYDVHSENIRVSKDKNLPNNRNAGQSIGRDKIVRSSSVQKNTIPTKKTIMSNLSTINLHKAEHNIWNLNNFNVSAKKEDKPMKYNFDNEITNYNNYLTKKLTANASSNNIYGSNMRFKKPLKLLEDLKVKIDELNLTASNEQQQHPNKTFQNFSKSKQILDNMIENLREELAGISKLTTHQEKAEQGAKENYLNENSSVPISDVIINLQAKNEELSKQLLSFKEKFVDINLENVDLRNKLKENSSYKKKGENFNVSSHLHTGASDTGNKTKILKSASKEKMSNLEKLHKSPTIISLNLKTQGNSNLEAIKKLAEKVKEKELEIAMMDDRIKNLTLENKNAEKNLIKAENKNESLQKIISEVLAKSKKDQKVLENLKEQMANANNTALNQMQVNKSNNFENQQLNTESNLNNMTNLTAINSKLFDYKNHEILIHQNFKINKQNDFILISDTDQLKFAWINLFSKDNSVFAEAIDFYNNLYNKIMNNNNFHEEPENYENLIEFIPDFLSINSNLNSNTKIKNLNSLQKIRLIFKNLDLELGNNTGFNNNIKPVYLPIEDSNEYLSQTYKFNLRNLITIQNKQENIPLGIPKINTNNNNNSKVKEAEIEALKKERENMEQEFNESKNYLIAELENRDNIICNLKSDLEKLLNDNSVFIENIEKLNIEIEEKNKSIEDLLLISKENEEQLNKLKSENKTLKENNNKKDSENINHENILKSDFEKISKKYEAEVKNYENLLNNLKLDYARLDKESNNEKNNLNTKLKNLEEENSEYKREIEKLKKAETKASQNSLIFKDSINKEIENKQDEIKHLYSEIEALNKDNAVKLSEIKKLKLELDNLKNEISIKQIDLDKTKVESQNFGAEINSKSIELNKLKKELDNSKIQEKEQSEIIKTLKLNLAQRDSDILNANIENKNLINKLSEKSKTIESLSKDYEALQQETAEREKTTISQNSNLNNTLISFNNQIAGLMNQIKDLEEEIANLKSNHLAEKENLVNNIEEKSAQVKSLNQIIQERENSIKKFNDLEKRNSEKLIKYDYEIEEFKKMVTKKDQDLENLDEQINSLNEILNKNELLINQLSQNHKEEIQNYLKEKQDFDQQLKTLIHENEEFTKKNQIFEADIKKLKEDIAKKTKEINTLKDLCEAKSQELSLIKDELKNFKNSESNKNEIQLRIDNLQNENAQLKAEKIQINQNIKLLEKTIEGINSEKLSLNEKIMLFEKAETNLKKENKLNLEKKMEFENDILKLQKLLEENDIEIESLRKSINQLNENNETLKKGVFERDNKLEKYENDSALAKENLNELKQQITKKVELINDLNSSLERKDEENKSLQLQFNKITNESKGKDEKIKFTEEKLSNLAKELAESKKELQNVEEKLIIKINNLEKIIQEKDKILNEQNLHKNMLENNLSLGKKANEDFEIFKLECEEKFNLIESENKELEELIIAYNQEIEILKNQTENFKKFEEENLDLIKVADKQDKILSEKNNEISNLKKANTELEQKTDNLTKSVNESNKQVKELEFKLNNLQDELAELGASSSHRENEKMVKIERLQKENLELTSEIIENKIKHEEKIKSLQSDIEDLEINNDTYSKNILSLSNDIENYQEKINILESGITNHVRDKERLSEELLAKEETLNALSELINEKITLINNFEEEIEALKNENDILNNNIEELNNKLNQITSINKTEISDSHQIEKTNKNNIPTQNYKNCNSQTNNNLNNSNYHNSKTENTYDSIIMTDPNIVYESNLNPNANKIDNSNSIGNQEKLISTYEEKIEKLNKTNLELNNQLILLTKELKKSSSNFKEENFPSLNPQEKDSENHKKEIILLKENIQRLDLENTQLKGLISDNEKCIEELEVKIADFSQNIHKTNTDLEEKLLEKENENENLLEKINIYEYALNDLKEKETYFIEQLNKLQNEKDLKEKELEAYLVSQGNNKIANDPNYPVLNQQVQILKTSLEEKEQEIYELREALEIYDQKINELESKQKAITSTRLMKERDEDESENIEVYKEQIETLKNLIRERDSKINELKNELDSAKLDMDKYLNSNDDDLKSRMSFNISSTDPNDDRKQAEKLERYKSAAQDYKQNNEHLRTQLNFLKEEIKSQKAQKEDLLNFEGRIKNYEDFKNLFSVSTENYKPKKKEQEEALKKLKDHLSINFNELGTSQLLTDNSSVNQEKKKGGLLRFFSKKK